MKLLYCLLLLYSSLSAGFLRGTWVKTPHGAERVENMKVGSLVSSPLGGTTQLNQVVCYEPESVYVVTIQDTAVCVTASVEFYDPFLQQWVPACELTTANHVITSHNQRFKVTDTAQCPIDQTISVYNLSLDPVTALYISHLEIQVRH